MQPLLQQAFRSFEFVVTTCLHCFVPPDAIAILVITDISLWVAGVKASYYGTLCSDRSRAGTTLLVSGWLPSSGGCVVASTISAPSLRTGTLAQVASCATKGQGCAAKFERPLRLFL